ncbi:hypothetical protein Tco_0365674 [Tanacetum coccineum]
MCQAKGSSDDDSFGYVEEGVKFEFKSDRKEDVFLDLMSLISGFVFEVYYGELEMKKVVERVEGVNEVKENVNGEGMEKGS